MDGQGAARLDGVEHALGGVGGGIAEVEVHAEVEALADEVNSSNNFLPMLEDGRYPLLRPCLG